MAALPNPILYAIPAFVILMIAEMLLNKSGKGYETKDTVVSLLLGAGSQIAGFLTAGAVLGSAFLAHQFALFDIPFTWWGCIACFVLDDLVYYAFHRSAHRVRWFWASHVNHHSSQHYNLSTALRQTWTGFFAASFIFRIPLILIGFPVEMVVFAGGINLIYQFWIHTEAIGRMPKWFEAVMNTPSHHRVHHANNPRYLDRNYAGVFIIWDKMFGTFTPEVDDEPIRYGIVQQLGSFGLFWSVFHEWIGIFTDIWRAPWPHKLSYLLCPPGWSHDNSRATSDSIRANWQQRQDQMSDSL